MKKVIILASTVFLIFLNIMCSKSQESAPKKASTAQVNDVTVGGGCTCSDQDSSGIYTPTFTSFNVAGVIFQKAIFTKVKNIVTVDGRFNWQSANSIGQGALVTISLPIGPAPTAGAAFGAANIVELGGFVNGVFFPTLYTTRSFINQTPGAVMQLQFNVQTTLSGGGATYHFVYPIIPAQ